MDEPSPKRRRRDGAADVSSPTPDAQSASARAGRNRPSFSSPTRDGTSRNHPQRRQRQSGSPTRQPNSRASARQSGGPSPSRRRPARDAQASEPDRGNISNLRRVEDEQDRDPSRTAPARPQRGGILAPPRQSPSRPQPQPRPLPPPGPAGDNEFVPRPRTNQPATGISIRSQPAPEPELPPARPDPVSSTPPKGIHSSPSRWRGKGSKQKNSPLKQPPMGISDQEPRPVPTPQALRRRPQQAAVDDANLDRTTDPARMVSLEDSDKIKERNELRKELAQLQRDLDMAGKENERLLSMQNSGRYVAPSDENKIFDLLQRSLIPADPLALPPQSQQLMMAALNPMGLLPFSKPSATMAPEKDDTKDIKSHHPVELPAEEELRYLQIFSPFDVDATIAALPATTQHPFRQRRLLTLRSKESLFHARIEMIVNPMSLAIFELNVSALESAARAELDPFINMICSGRCNRSMQRNVGVLFWAMGEWHRIAIERAGIWARLDKELAAKGVVVSAANLRKRSRDGDADNTSRRTRISLKGSELMRLMGKQSYDIVIDTEQDTGPLVQLRLEWKIGFDWTGEAESKLAVLLGVPGKWRKVDRRGSLGKLPGLFHSLVRGGEDVDLATRKVAALLVGAVEDE